MLLRLLLLTLFTTMTVFSQQPSAQPGVSRDLARWRAERYSDIRYKLDLTLEKMSPVLKGTIEIRVHHSAIDQTEPLPMSIILDWRAIRGKEDLSKISNVVLNGKPAEFEEKNEHIVIKNAVVGENVVKLDFTSPILASGSAITRYVDRQDQGEYLYSLFVPSDASTAFPVFDQPDLKGRFTLSIKAPQDWKIVSNSRPNEIQQLPTTHSEDWKNKVLITQFAETKPISTYVFAFAAGDFEKFEEIEIGGKRSVIMRSPVSETGERIPNPGIDGLNSDVYVRRSQAEKFKQHAGEVFRLNRAGVKFLESYFDYKYPFSKYDLVLIPEFPFGGMEHAGATFLREESIIFPQEPTANNYISRANLIFHEAAHQWFGDTVTMRWFDDLWLKEGFAEFMAYKTLEKVMPEYDAWKVFYERNKQSAYLTDSTKGTTPIYQEIPNLSAAKSAYGNIVYRKAPSFLKQTEFYFGAERFQRAVRAFLKRHEYANAGWGDLVSEFEAVEIAELKRTEYFEKLSPGDKAELERFERWSVNKEWAEFWVQKPGMPTYRISPQVFEREGLNFGQATGGHTLLPLDFSQTASIENFNWLQNIQVIKVYDNGYREEKTAQLGNRKYATLPDEESKPRKEFKFSDEFLNSHVEAPAAKETKKPLFVFPNYRDYGYGIFLLDEKSRTYILANIQNEPDDFLRTMMWGSLWDSVREAELDPKAYVDLVIKNLPTEKDETTIATLLGRVSTAMTYYLSGRQRESRAYPLEALLLERMKNSGTLGQKLTFYRSFLNIATTANARKNLKEILKAGAEKPAVPEGITRAVPAPSGPFGLPPLKTKDKFDIVAKLISLGDPEGLTLLDGLEKTEKTDEARRYAYAARAGIPTNESKAKFFADFTSNKEISESWIEAAFGPFNSVRHSNLTLPYLEKALAELPNLKRSRRIFFVNGWLGAFIGGQRNEAALNIVRVFLDENPKLDRDLRLKILENVDVLERAAKIQRAFGGSVPKPLVDAPPKKKPTPPHGK